MSVSINPTIAVATSKTLSIQVMYKYMALKMNLLENFDFVSGVAAPEARFRLYAAVYKKYSHFLIYRVDEREFPTKIHCQYFITEIYRRNFPSVWRAFFVLNDASGRLTFLCFQRFPTLQEVCGSYYISPELGFYILIDVLLAASYLDAIGSCICKICPENLLIGLDLRCYVIPAELASNTVPSGYDAAFISRDAFALFFKIVFGRSPPDSIPEFKLPRLISNALEYLKVGNYKRIFEMKTVKEAAIKRVGHPYFCIAFGKDPYSGTDRLFRLVNGFDVPADLELSTRFEGKNLTDVLFNLSSGDECNHENLLI